MKCLTMLGLLALAAAALMAFAATASAGNVTNPTNTVWTGEIHATAGEMTLHGVWTVTCNQSTVVGSVEQHGSGVTG